MAHVLFMEGHRRKINIFLCIEAYLEVTGLASQQMLVPLPRADGSWV